MRWPTMSYHSAEMIKTISLSIYFFLDLNCQSQLRLLNFQYSTTVYPVNIAWHIIITILIIITRWK